MPNTAHMCPNCHNRAVYKVYENDYDDLYICDECGEEFSGQPAFEGGLKFTPYKDYAYEAIKPYRGYKIKDVDDKKVVITPNDVEDAEFDDEDSAKDWIDNKSSMSAKETITQLFSKAKKLSYNQIDKYIISDAQSKLDPDNTFLVKFKTKSDRVTGEAKAKKLGFIVVDRTDDKFAKMPYWSFFSIDDSDKWLNEDAEKPNFEVRQYKDDIYGIYDTKKGIWLNKGEKYAMQALANEYNDKSTGLTEAAPQLEQPTDSMSIVDMIKMGYEHGLFDKLKNIGRENAYTVDISGVDKDRIVGYFGKRKEFNREDHNEAGVHSVEFISNTLDIEVFDSFVQIYRIPQNESISEDTDWSKENDSSFKYQMLDRLKSDCKYFLGNGNGCCKYIWNNNVEDHIQEMKNIYNSFADEDKPDWISLDDINEFESKMKAKLNTVIEDFDTDVQSDELVDDTAEETPLSKHDTITKLLSNSNIDYTDLRDTIVARIPRNSINILSYILNDLDKLNANNSYATNNHNYKLIIDTTDNDTIDNYVDDYDDEFSDDLDFELPENTDVDESLAPADYNPKITGKAYKVFRVKNGKLYPPMVANPGGADTPVGVWLKADEGEFAGLSKTGRKQVKSIGSGTLSYRPGWHLGDLPLAKQFYRTNKETGEKEFPKDFVWAECEYVMEKDYQDDAMKQGYTKNGKFQHSLAGLPRVPENGFYRYRTNPNPDTIPWVITGAMKVERLLDDAEVAEILAKHGLEAPNRQGGNKTLAELGLSN